MKSVVLLGLFVLFLVAVQFVRGKTVDEIIEKHVRSIGGFDKKDTIQSIYMEGVVIMLGNTNLVKIYKEQNEFSLTGFSMQWQITGEEGVVINPTYSATDNKLLNDVIAKLQTEPEILAPLLNYVETGYQPVLTGKEVIDGNNCYTIKLNTKAGNDINYWFNTTSFQLTRVLIENNENENYQKKAIQTFYSNYKLVDGMPMAHTIEISTDGLNENDPIKISFTKIEINQPFKKKFSTYNNQS